MPDLPIVCARQPGELNARAAELLPGVVAAARARHAIENGFRFEFQAHGDVLASLARMIDARDSIYFDSTVPTRIGSPGARACRALVVTTG